MKSFFVEYANIVATTILGLLFGLSFFLLYVNFYHYKEIQTTYTPNTENGTDYENILAQVNEIRSDANSYYQATYRGQESIYDMSGLQTKFNSCMDNFESEELKKLLDKETFDIRDVSDLIHYYQNRILNDCLVVQLYNIANEENPSIQIERLKVLAPFIKNEIDLFISTGVGYVKSNIRNNDSYYFSNQSAKNTIFELTKNSYLEIINRYKQSLTFIKTLSGWYRTVAQGG